MNCTNLEVASEEHAKALLSKLADLLQKMQSIDSFPPSKQKAIATRVEEVYIPIAHRLGLYRIKAVLEDMHLKFTDPEAYHTIARQFKGTQTTREQLLHRFQRILRNILAKKGFTCSIKARVKSITSIQRKMKRLGIPFEEVYDLFATRVILDTPLSQENTTCWQVCHLLTNLYTVHPIKFRNWLDDPRPNGYQSLHVTVKGIATEWVEVQIRTTRMDELAEKGSAAHWKYKENNGYAHLVRLGPWLAQIRTILEKKPQLVREALGAARRSPALKK